MASKPIFDWYLPQWLDSLRMSQADLVRASGFPKAKVSLLVNGHAKYNRDVVNTISFALNIAPYELLMHPADAHRIRRLRTTALEIAAENQLDSPPDTDEKRAVQKN